MKQTIILKQEKPCKGSIRYKAVSARQDEGPVWIVTDQNPAALDTVYLSRAFANPMPSQITITVEGA